MSPVATARAALAANAAGPLSRTPLPLGFTFAATAGPTPDSTFSPDASSSSACFELASVVVCASCSRTSRTLTSACSAVSLVTPPLSMAPFSA